MIFLNDRDVINKFHNLKLSLERKKKKFIESNPDVADYLKKVSRTAIEIAKIKLNKNKPEEKKDELTKKFSLLLSDKCMYEKTNSVKYRCSICNDSGIVNGKTCKCLRNLVKEEQFGILSKQLPLNEFTFEKFNLNFYSSLNSSWGNVSDRECMRRKFKQCVDYARRFGINSPSLLFYGVTGAGKTHLAGAIINVLIEKGFRVVYYFAPGLIQNIEKKKFFNDEISSDVFVTTDQDDAFSCDLLVLDDLGAEFITRFSKSVIYSILDARAMRKLPTIITSNFSINDLERKYDNGIMSRIVGNFRQFMFVGSDIRQAKLKLRGDFNVPV